MSMINFIAIITEVGMWVTPNRLLHEGSRQYFWSYPYFNVSQTTRFARFNFKMATTVFKNGKAARFYNAPLLFTGWHKAALKQN
jgi:hypothetical protein